MHITPGKIDQESFGKRLSDCALRNKASVPLICLGLALVVSRIQLSNSTSSTISSCLAPCFCGICQHHVTAVTHPSFVTVTAAAVMSLSLPPPLIPLPALFPYPRCLPSSPKGVNLFYASPLHIAAIKLLSTSTLPVSFMPLRGNCCEGVCHELMLPPVDDEPFCFCFVDDQSGAPPFLHDFGLCQCTHGLIASCRPAVGALSSSPAASPDHPSHGPPYQETPAKHPPGP